MLRHLSFLIMAMSFGFFVSSLPAADTPDEVLLKSKGLTRVRQFYLLEADAKLPETMQAMRETQRAVEKYRRERAKAQNDIEAAIATIDELAEKKRVEDEKLSKIKKTKAVATYNEQLAKVSSLQSHINEGVGFIQKRQRDLREMKDPSDVYVAAVRKLAAEVDEIAKKYESLATDVEVMDAIARLNETSKPAVKLGPWEFFQREAPKIRELNADLKTATIDLEIVGSRPHLTATFNNVLPVPMVIDTGASDIVLLRETATKLGWKESRNDKIEKVIIADGSTVEVRVATFDSIRIGPFTIKNIECLVQPPGKGNTNLLGGTFLQHFVYQIDMTAGVLTLSQINLPETEAPKPDSGVASGEKDPSIQWAKETTAQGTNIPTQKEITEAMSRIRELFKNEYDDDTERGRRALAGRMHSQGLDGAGDNASRYVLLREAYEVGKRGRDIERMIAVATDLADTFGVDPLPMYFETAVKVGPTWVTADSNERLTELCLLLVDIASTQGDFENANDLLETAELASSKAKVVELAARVERKTKQVQWLRVEHGKARLAKQRLEKAPEDAASNMVLGRWHCLVLGNWQAGLPMLARGDNGPLSQAAKGEVSDSTSSSGQFAIAQSWWQAAAAESGDSQRRAKLRAAYWYRTALRDSALDAQSRDNATKRLADMESTSEERNDEAWFGGKEFQIYRYGCNWPTARTFSSLLAGRLVCIHSSEEQAVVSELSQGERAWIGASDGASEGNWQWTDGQPMSYTNWHKNQPDNARGREHAAHIVVNSGGQWNDDSDRTRAYFIVERGSLISKPAPTTQPAESPLRVETEPRTAIPEAAEAPQPTPTTRLFDDDLDQP